MSKRFDKTLADYVVGGVMPALLIGLLVSLCYFLLELALSGQNLGQLKWVLFFFIVGTVLIARIAMRGDIADRAAVYGIALAIAAGLALVRFVEIPQTALGGLGWLVPIALMSVIWWSAHKLTLDSTFDEDAEVEEAGGLFDAAPATQPMPGKKQQDWFGEYQAEREAEQKRKKPGTMLIYFSLAALPLFGLGQAILPAADHERRRYAFWLLTLYVACGLGMLLTTSFLGLRRYLRGRRLQMPAAMTGMWLGLGAGLILTLMFLSAYLLPRPEAEYSLAHLLGWAGSKQRDANRTHFFEGSTGRDNRDASGSGRTEQRKGEQAGDTRDGQRGERRGQQQRGGPSGQRQSGELNARSGGGQNNQGGRSGQGEQSQQKGEQGGQGQGNNGQGKDQSQQGDGKTGSQGGQSGGNQKDGQRQPGQRGEQDAQGKGGGQTPDKDGERGNREQGPGQGEKSPENQRKDPNDPGQQQRHPNEDRSGQNQGENQKEQQDQGSGSGSQQEQQQPPQPPPTSQQAAPTSWDWLNWIVYALIAAGVIFALWKWGKQIWAALSQMWREMLAWWNGLFGTKDQAGTEAELPDPESDIPPQPFACFSNPLLTPGRFKSMDEMIRYSFAALHSWAYEQNLGRQPDETPTEFAHRLGQQRQWVHQDVRKLADLYAVVTYARANLPASCEVILRNFWNRLADEPTRPMVVN